MIQYTLNSHAKKSFTCSLFYGVHPHFTISDRRFPTRVHMPSPIAPSSPLLMGEYILWVIDYLLPDPPPPADYLLPLPPQISIYVPVSAAVIASGALGRFADVAPVPFPHPLPTPYPISVSDPSVIQRKGKTRR